MRAKIMEARITARPSQNSFSKHLSLKANQISLATALIRMNKIIFLTFVNCHTGLFAQTEDIKIVESLLMDRATREVLTEKNLSLKVKRRISFLQDQSLKD